jgi:uncharacterized cofD-like protein
MLSSSEVNPRAINAIERADAIVLGPGDLYTSTIPNLLVPGIAKAINTSHAKKILITNIMTKLGETWNYGLSDFMNELTRYIGGDVFDTIVACSVLPPGFVRQNYAAEHAAPIIVSPSDEFAPRVIFRNLLQVGPLAHHDPALLQTVLKEILEPMGQMKRAHHRGSGQNRYGMTTTQHHL